MGDQTTFPSMTGKTLLQLLPALQSGGVERGAIDVATAFVEAGGRAIIASKGGRLTDGLQRRGVEHVTLPLGTKTPWAVKKNAGQIADLIKAEKVDILHARSRIPAWVGHYAKEATGIPFVTTWHGKHDAKSFLKKRYNSSLVQGDRVIAISDYIRRRILADYPDVEGKLITIPRGVDLETFTPEQVPGGRIIRLVDQWRVPDDRPVILLPGRLTRWKGQDLFLDALALVLKDCQGSDTPIPMGVLAGDSQGKDKFPKQLMKQIKKLGLESAVAMPGHVDDMAAAYNLATIVVAPSRDPEPFGRVPIEAQAMGAIPIAFAHGGFEETIKDGKTGYLVPPGDVAGLAEAMKTALGLSDQDRDRMTRAGRSHVEAHFTNRGMCAATLGVYQDLLGQ